MRNNILRRARPYATATLLAAGSLTLATGATASDKYAAEPQAVTSEQVFPTANLSRHSQAEEAIDGLGDKLTAVAAYYDRSSDAFAGMLHTDPNLWLDSTGRAYFIDHRQGVRSAQAVGDEDSNTFHLAETFMLNSRPGAKRVIYLDFRGHATVGTAWNQHYDQPRIESPAYSEDSVPTFSSGELRSIQRVWKTVAGHFAAYDVNVTTQYPGQSKMTRRFSGDQAFGTRVIITTDTFANCLCNGLSYLGSFDDTGDRYKPVFVFASTSDVTASLINHQVEHSLNLAHQDSGMEGHTYRTALANSGVQPLLDDHGATLKDASPLHASSEGSDSRLDGAGQIGEPGDEDMFQFFAGEGSFSIEVNPASQLSQQAMRVELYNEQGLKVASANPRPGRPAVLGGRLKAGPHYLLVNMASESVAEDQAVVMLASPTRYSIGGIVPHPGHLGVPEALALADYEIGEAPRPVNFDGTGFDPVQNDIVSWHWDFGDGNMATGATASHTYDEPGTYTATLTITDRQGYSDTDSVAIAVDEHSQASAHEMSTTENPAAQHAASQAQRTEIAIR